MSVLVTLLDHSPFLILPGHWIGWLGLAIPSTLMVFLLWRWQRYNLKFGTVQWVLFFILFLLTPVTSLFFGLQILPLGALPPSGLPIDLRGSVLMFFAALPWFFAAGLLGPLAATLLAAFSGLLLGLWSTHSLLTALEMALLAVVLGAAMNQRIRKQTFRLIRHPIIAGLFLALGYPLLFLVDNSLFFLGLSPGMNSLVTSLDYAITHTMTTSLAFAGQIIVAAIFAQTLAVALPQVWGRWLPTDDTLYETVPAERSLEARFFYTMGPLFSALVIALLAGGWIVVGNVARQMLQERMIHAAETGSESIHFFLEAGQDLILRLARNQALVDKPPEALQQALQDSYYTLPFFQQLVLIDYEGNEVASFPAPIYQIADAPLDEAMGIELALNGVLVQSYAIPPAEGEQAAQVAFLAAIKNEKDQTRGVLIGYTNLAVNPYTRSVIANLDSMLDVGGDGFLLDENGQILYHHSPELLMSMYTGVTFQDKPLFFDQNSADGTRRLIYYQPTVGRPWAVVMSVPASRVQLLALSIALPLLGMVVLTLLIALVLFLVGLRMIISSLRTLAIEADRIAHGELDHELAIEQEDEIGQLRRSFEKMRLSLKDRLEELRRLLYVSQTIAATLDIKVSVQPILKSALESGASAVRIVLDPKIMPELEDVQMSERMSIEERESPVQHAMWSFGLGSGNEAYEYLDSQLLTLMHEKNQTVITNPSRLRVLNLKRDETGKIICPQVLVAEALRHENLYYGVFWVGYDQPRQLMHEEINFLSTLASQGALAASNARLFLNAEIGRQRLAAILASVPDPVLVTDQRNCLLLANPAAWQVLGFGLAPNANTPIEEVITQPGLLELLKLPDARKVPEKEMETVEVSMPGDRIYLATASSITMDGQSIGRICVLQDVTHFKALDALKSEFVANVSHDLRSPLTLIRGYGTMLEMVGELNEQQGGYVRKIMGGIESMSRLVNNLLDMGRIEAGLGLQLEIISVNDLLSQVVDAFQEQATQRQVQLNVELGKVDESQALFTIEADKELLQQALKNLVDNALKYTEAGGKVAVRVDYVPHTAKGSGTLFSIRDTGIGIAPVDQTRLFEKFYRVARRGGVEPRGTGLGLAIVKSIAERHGGEVRVESQLGKGSVFYMFIPEKTR